MSHGSAIDVPGFKVSTIFPVVTEKKKDFFFFVLKWLV